MQTKSQWITFLDTERAKANKFSSGFDNLMYLENLLKMPEVGIHSLIYEGTVNSGSIECQLLIDYTINPEALPTPRRIVAPPEGATMLDEYGKERTINLAIFKLRW